MKLVITTAKLGALLAGSTLLMGCATPALWAKKEYQPTALPNLELGLTQDGKDVLVCYDEHCEKSARTQRRAYWLFAPQKEKPHFTNPESYEHLDPIPVINVAETNAAPVSGYYVIADPESWSFELCKDRQTVRSCTLPSYKGAPPATFWRVSLTPLAAAADGAIICLAACAAGGAYGGGGCGIH